MKTDFIINGKEASVEGAATVLEACAKLSLKIPTLCAHKALLPYGACRLCLVEIGKPPYGKIQTACTYPLKPGLVVSTDTERIMKARKIVMELLLARCPDVKAIQDLAGELGVAGTRFHKKDSDCILCGMCIRVCRERMGVEALGFANRGSKREVRPPFDALSEFCQACGACEFICPTGKMKVLEVGRRAARPIPFEFNEGLISRPAVHIPYPQAVPNKAALDGRYCVRLLKDKCGICQVFCEAGAIDYEQKEERIELKAGAVILAPGFELFDAKLKGELGYGRYPNVITSLEFERILNASGPFSGKVLRPSDRRHPKKIAFIQCVGSRDCDNNYCSSVCCMYATKEAIIAMEHEKGLECAIFFIDLRAFGKGFDAYYERAKKAGVRYVRCRPSSIKEDPSSRDLEVRYEAEDGTVVSEGFDLVVLSSGLRPTREARDMAKTFGLSLNEHGFCRTGTFAPVETGRAGVYVCGPFTEPKDIPETVMQASAAAAKTLSLLSSARGSLIEPKGFPPEKDVSGRPPRIGVFVCHCGTNIAGVVNVPEVVEYVKGLPDVAYAENDLYTCSNDAQERIKQLVREHDLNRVVVASCTPRTHEPLFRNTIREAGVNPYLFEMANIRDQCSWVHMHEPEQATRKAKDLLRMAIAKARLLEPLQRRTMKVHPDALVIGGGVSGMTAALDMAKQGITVHLVEREGALGGGLRRTRYLLDGEDPKGELDRLVANVLGEKLIRVHLNSKIVAMEGSWGNFKTKVSGVGNGGAAEFGHGVVVVATGAREYQPQEYLYGKDERVTTQLELESLIADGKFRAKSVVMIQCVGSRNDEHPYCSRVCCTEAVKNALKIKATSPDSEVYVLYRDVRTYGFREQYYRQAREKGVVFLRYDDDKKPAVEVKEGGLQVSAFDPILKTTVSIDADLLVLSAGIVANPDSAEVGQMLKVPLNQDKFFLEAHMKLRPVDFASDGIFLCGLAHSPKDLTECLMQASGAAARASAVALKGSVELEANVSRVLDENCDGCAYCVDPCPYKAITLIEYMFNGAIKKTVEANESVCKGCGVCQATCPKKGIAIMGFRLEQISAMAEAALQAGGAPSGKPAEELVRQ
ncbi:MAG: FAD-dependent oxidoreductase [Elusimicrobia bacterium]|nr:FAD-dependent oxidoreductase [Elusimicrobiota bacterium]